ncbi:FhaA domain-containing protein [Herbiconiux sp. SYSU D00978]|uniref:FhaA domain-containing protein n=1 Tax=Herbiconiux sp. SYSU D00978 TaxID=2812562 RepID=UPI001A97341B|nr:DUF3662 and FHA domain-containing protein [Herbiconiux sp. SYSU D00978]
MGLLDNFERGLERAVNGAFAKTFRSGVQPLEITAALKREVDTKATMVSRDRILAPNTFRVFLAPNDFDRMSQVGGLTDELTQLVQQHATTQHYSFAGPVRIGLERDDSLSDGILQIESESVKGHVSWTPVLDINGKRYPITHSRTVIGRGSEADITVDDSGISRKHVEIRWDGRRAEVHDLGSTNGSKLNGRPVKASPLEPDSVIDIGRTRVVFRVLPKATDAGRAAR